MSNLLLTVGGAALLINGGLATIPTAYEGTVTMNVFRSTLEVAPETVMWEIDTYSGFDTSAPSGTFDERWHDFVFLWDFGDTGATYSVPTRLPTAHKNANVGYGPAVAHTYSPGTYNVSCLVIEMSSGKQALYEHTVVVQDPDTVFSGKTITVGPSGRDYTSLIDALNAADAADDLRRIVLDRGQTFDVSAGYQFRHSKTFKNVYVCAADGAGAKPILSAPTTALAAPFSNVVFAAIQQMNYGTLSVSGDNELDMQWVNIRFEGSWDAATESGTPLDFFNASAAQGPIVAGRDAAPRYWAFHGCEFDGGSKAVHGTAAELFVLSECSITNWQDYGVLSIGPRAAILGTKIEQKVDCLSGGPKDTKHNNHGPIRSNIITLAMDGCELFSNNGWFPNVPGYRTQQPCIRFGFDGREGDAANIQRTIMEGGFDVLNITFQSDNTTQANMNVLVEKCYLLGTHMSQRIVTILYGGVTLRNNIMVRPDVPAIDGTFNLQGFVAIDIQSLTTGNEYERILIEHNQFVNLVSTANGGSSRAGFEIADNTGAGAFPNNLIERHNLLHEPNLGTPNVPYAPLSTSTIFTPLCDGYRRRWEVWYGVFGTDTTTDWNYGDTATIDYADGSINDSPNASSWQPNGVHILAQDQISGGYDYPLDFSVSFGATSCTITNLHGRYELFSGSLGTELATGATMDILYTNGEYANAEGGSDPGDDTYYVDPSGDHSFFHDTSSLGTFAEDPDITFTFFPTYVRLTNTGAAIGKPNAKYRFYLERKAANYMPRPNGRSFQFELERAATDLPANLTVHATPAGSAALYRQASGSAAIDPGSPGAAYDDYFGNVRAGVKDLGAFEGTG